MIYFYSFFFSTSNCERLQEVLLVVDMPGESIYKLGSGMYVYIYIYKIMYIYICIYIME